MPESTVGPAPIYVHLYRFSSLFLFLIGLYGAFRWLSTAILLLSLSEAENTLFDQIRVRSIVIPKSASIGIYFVMDNLKLI